MRKKIIAANWKMNNTAHEVDEFVSQFKESSSLQDLHENKQVIIAAPSIYLQEMIASTKDLPHVYIAAQNCYHEAKGAYTGEISAEQLASIDITHVLVGHSERRQNFNETDEQILQKIQHALSVGITPIFCCGEPLEERTSNQYKEYIQKQLEQSIFQLSKEDCSKIIIAYEPIWAIGTGNTASVEQAQEIHQMIRSLVADKFGTEIAQKVSILYGGSCNPTNASSLFEQSDIDGGLIGGASLQVVDFEKIILAS